jgi:hypothetical protein
MDLPHLNVLTKIDNMRNYPNLPFNLDYYTEVQDLNYLLPHLDREQSSGIPGPGPMPQSRASEMEIGEEEEDQPTSKFSALNKAIVELVEDFALVGFETLAVEDKKSMMGLLRAIDRAGGYAFGGVEGANDTVWQLAMRQDAVTMDARDVQERWLDRRDELDEEEQKAWEAEGKEMSDAPKGSTTITHPASASTAADISKKAGDSDDDMDDIEEMKKFMDGDKASGINVVRK